MNAMNLQTFLLQEIKSGLGQSITRVIWLLLLLYLLTIFYRTNYAIGAGYHKAIVNEMRLKKMMVC